MQARYLVERQDLDVYAKVLVPENEHRKEVVNQLVNTALPESKHPEMVSCCVKAFMAQDLQSELIKLLEMIVLQVRTTHTCLRSLTEMCLKKEKNAQNDCSRKEFFLMRCAEEKKKIECTVWT
jgi:hypothetical protein